MADRKITDLTALAAGSQATGDLLTIVDVSEAAATDKNKKITVESLFKGIPSNVGIGTSSPGDYGNFADDLVIYNSSQPGITLATGTSGYGSIYFADGTAGNAASRGQIQYNHSNDSLLFATAASERLRIDSSGRVGIGTSSPDGELDVTGTGDANGGVLVVNDAGAIGVEVVSSQPTILLNENDTTDENYQVRLNSGDLLIQTQTDARTGADTKVTIDSSGNVGIGTSSPLRTLHVTGAGDTGLMLQTTNAVNDKEIWEIQAAGDASNHANLIFRSRTNAGTGGNEALRITNDGNVGIGTTSPSNLLHVNGQARFEDFLRGHSTQNKLYIADDIALSATKKLYLDGGSNTYIHETSADNIAVVTSGSERLRIDSSGRLLVGTTSSRSSFFNGAAPAQFQTEIAAAAGLVNASFVNNGGGAGVIIGRSNGSSVGSNTIVSNGDSVGFIDFQAADGTNFEIAARIEAAIDGTPGNNDMPGRLLFSTTADGANSLSERMRITKDGHLLLGQSTTQVPGFGNTTVGCAFESVGSNGGAFFASRADGPVYFGNRNNDGNLHECRRSGNFVGSISVNSSSTAFNTSSDHRLKENVVALSGAIDRVKQLLPKRFNFIVDADTTVDGFLAHEAQTVVPEAVTGTHNEVDDDGNAVMQGIDQSKLVPLLTAALQEAIAEIETLKTKVAALEAG